MGWGCMVGGEVGVGVGEEDGMMVGVSAVARGLPLPLSPLSLFSSLSLTDGRHDRQRGRQQGHQELQGDQLVAPRVQLDA